MSTKPKAIIDCDTGSDDAVAVMLAVLSEKYELLGITTTHGNLPVKYTTENTLRVLELLGAEDIPVYPGCNEGMVKLMLPGRMINPDITPIAKIIDGKEVAIHDKYLALPEAKTKPQNKHACVFLLETLRAATEKITLITLGPVTNVGMVLRMDPSVAENIEEIVCMGGGIHEANKSMAAESNFFNDPEAAKLLLECGAKVTVIPLDATRSVSFGHDDAAKIRAVGTPAALFAADLVDHRITAGELLGLSNEPKDALHDALVVAYLIDPTVITEMWNKPLDIEIGGGKADGQLLCDVRDAGVLKYPQYVAMRGDKDKYLDMLCTYLAKQ